MKDCWWLVLIGTLACAFVSRGFVLTPALETPDDPATTTVVTRTALPSDTPRPTFTPSPTPTPTPMPTPTPIPGPALDAAGIHVFPQPLFAGDYVSVDVDPRMPEDVTLAENTTTFAEGAMTLAEGAMTFAEGAMTLAEGAMTLAEGAMTLAEGAMTLTLTLPDGSVLPTTVEPTGLDAQYQARFYWTWQVPDLAGTLPFTFELDVSDAVPDPDPADNVLSLTLPVSPVDAMVPPEPQAHWAVTEAQGFRLHYLTGTAAARDLPELLRQAQAAHANVTRHLDANGVGLDIYLLDRVIGQGGYASSDWVAVTYTDRMYAPVGFGMVLQHELTHRLDRAIGCEDAPSLLREGLAVYLPGGHYHPESLRHKAATIVATGQDVALADLLDGFYLYQHEISYAEAGAWMMYLVEVHGWEGVGTLCRTITETEAGTPVAQFEAGIQQALGAGDLASLESAWLAWVTEEEVTEADEVLLDVELRLMEAMRAYQVQYDLSAHFLEGILFSAQEAEQREIVADFVRRPHEPEAIALELLLAMAQDAVREGDVNLAALALRAVEQVLADGNFASGLASDALGLARAALAEGYEPYHLLPEDDGRYALDALDRADWPVQRRFVATFDAGMWTLAPVP